MQVNKTKLLVVDDLEEVREYLKSYFGRRNYLVLTSASGEEALEIIKIEMPEIMLLDVNLPKMSGIDLVKIIRQFNKKIKVIMVSGYDLYPQDDPLFKELGVLEFMRKPIGLAELEMTIKRAVTD